MDICMEKTAYVPSLLKRITSYALHVKPLLFPNCRKRFEQQQKMLEEDRKRRQFEEQKQKLRLLSSVKPKVRVSSIPVYFYFVFFIHSTIQAHP